MIVNTYAAVGPLPKEAELLEHIAATAHDSLKGRARLGLRNATGQVRLAIDLDPVNELDRLVALLRSHAYSAEFDYAGAIQGKRKRLHFVHGDDFDFIYATSGGQVQAR